MGTLRGNVTAESGPSMVQKISVMWGTEKAADEKRMWPFLQPLQRIVVSKTQPLVEGCPSAAKSF